MLSAQCDELRAMAESVGLEMPQAATLMMEAADTIWELRESVHRERAEADRLREELEAVGIAAYSYGRGDLKAENVKLRELVWDLYLCSDETCTDCEHHDYSGEGFWCKRGVGWKRARMRVLGVEVDG